MFMASISSLKASDGTGNASVATVQSVRSSGATTLVVDTVQGINTKFHATMGTPHTFVDPVTSETITVISEASAVDFVGHVDGSNLEIDTIAPGFTDAGSAVNDIVIIKPTTQWADEVAEVLEVSHDDDGTLKDDTVETAAIKDLNVTTGKLADGAVTPAKWTNPYCFRAYASGSTTLTDGTYVKVLFASENYDYNNNFASSTYTAPVAGVYNFSSTVTQATVSATPAIIFLTLYVNGSAAARGVAFTPSTVGVPCVTYAGDVLLAANDTVEIYCYQDSAGNEATITGSELTFFSGHLVHKV